MPQGSGVEAHAALPARFSLTAVAVALLVAALTAACASAPRAVRPRDFGPADDAARAHSLLAWDEALRRADSLPPSRLLYDLKYSKGAWRASGTLAVVARTGELTATVTGPFGTPIGEYRDGAFRLKNEEPFRLDGKLFRGILAGVWREGAPEVIGADRGESLLRWKAPGGLVVDGVFDVSSARLRSLRARGPNGELSVSFPGAFEPWPDVVEIVSIPTGQALRLRRELVEPIRD